MPVAGSVALLPMKATPAAALQLAIAGSQAQVDACPLLPGGNASTSPGLRQCENH
jgi:hypothetical protein